MLTSVVPFFSSVLSYLLVLTVIVFVHEMGHYWVARWNGVAIQTFSIGFGPELFGFNDRRGTRWRLSAIPMGGYVRFLGDMNATSATVDPDILENADEALLPRLFVNKSVWQRIAIVVAGPAANVLLTFFIVYALLLGVGRYTLPPVISAVEPLSVAAQAGLQAGDTVLSVDGFKVRGFKDFQRFVATAPGHQIAIGIKRNGSQQTILATPKAVETKDRFGNVQRIGQLGVSRLADESEVSLYKPDPIEAVGMAFEEIHFIVSRTAAFLGDFFVGRGDVQQLGGTIKVAKISSEAVSLGWVAVASLIAMISLNIGLVNLLPIPMLDGGHLIYYLFEAIRGRPLSVRAQEIGFRFGLAIVVSLTVFTVINDIF
jgi:regulator of sigma E protease